MPATAAQAMPTGLCRPGANSKEQVFQYVRMLLQMGDWRRAEMFLMQVQSARRNGIF
ncbi:MAG: hypothetical protein ACLT0Y_04700 [Christensenellales bacterium]